MIVQEIATLESLAALGPEWLALWAQTGAMPFQHPAFALTWWNAFHPGRIAAAAFFKDGRLKAIAPFYREDRTDRLLIIGMGLGDYLDVIAERDDATVSAIERYIAAVPPPVSLEDLPPSSVLCGPASVRHRLCPVSDLSQPVPSTMRRSVALARNRMVRRGAWEVTRSEPPIPPEAVLRLGALHRARQDSLGRPSIFDDPRAVQMLLDLAATTGFPMRLYEARIAGEPAAHAVTLPAPQGVLFWLLAMAPHFAFESPAKRLLAEIRDEAVAAGVPAIFWLRGDEPYKQAWGAMPDWSYALRRAAGGLRERA